MLKKIAAFWQQNKKVIVTTVTIISGTAAAPYLSVLVPLADIAAEQIVPVESQPGQSHDAGK